MYLWVFLCFLSAFATTGDFLVCFSCSQNSDSCSSGFAVKCSTDELCAAQNTIYITDSVISNYTKKSCAPPNECNVNGTFTYNNTSERTVISCCSDFLCNQENPTVPTVNPEPNGVMCPTCTSPGDSCGTDQNQKCTGDETMCLLVSAITIKGPQSEVKITRGCASIGYCMRNDTNVTTDGGYVETTYQCTNGTRFEDTTTTSTFTGGASHCSFSPSAMVSLLVLLKLI